MTQSSTPQGAVCKHCDKEIKLIGKYWHLSFGDLEQCSGATLCLSKESLLSQHEPVAEPASTGEPATVFEELRAQGHEPPESVKLVGNRLPTESEIEYGKTLEPMARECLERNKARMEQAARPSEPPAPQPSTPAEWRRQESCSECDGDGCANCAPQASPKEVAEQSAEPIAFIFPWADFMAAYKKMRWQTDSSTEEWDNAVLACDEAYRKIEDNHRRPAPQPVAGEGPRCTCNPKPFNGQHWAGCPEGTPKLEEFVKAFLSRLAGLSDEQSSNVAETLSHMLRSFIPSSTTPTDSELTRWIGDFADKWDDLLEPRIQQILERDEAATYNDLYLALKMMLEIHSRDKCTEMACGCYGSMAANILRAATSASTGEAQALLVMGDCYKCPACKMPLSGTPEGHLPDCVVRKATETNLKNDGWISPYEVSTGEANGWVSVRDRLPEYDTDVLLWGDGWKRVYFGYWRHSHEWIGRQRAEEQAELPDTNPTHWQPLPPAPSSVPPPEIKVKTVTPEELEREQNDPKNYMCSSVPQAEPKGEKG